MCKVSASNPRAVAECLLDMRIFVCASDPRAKGEGRLETRNFVSVSGRSDVRNFVCKWPSRSGWGSVRHPEAI
jgi:DNA-binding transcriptional LysR family regulator